MKLSRINWGVDKDMRVLTITRKIVGELKIATEADHSASLSWLHDENVVSNY